MSKDPSPSHVSDLLRRLPVSRRGFIGKVVAGAFVAPVVSSVALPAVYASGRSFSSSSSSSTSPSLSSGPSASSSIGGTPAPSQPGGSLSQPPSGSTPGGTGAPHGGDLVATADTFLRHDAMTTNEGANIRLRVGVSPISRAVVQFDEDEVASALPGTSQVLLVLTIANNHNTWTQKDDRSVCAHPLRTTFVEGDGHQSLMPGALAQRGSGPGATWKSSGDPNVADRRPRGRGHFWSNVPEWNGGAFGPATADPVPHLNLMEGTVTFDVTADVLDGATGWLLKVDDEHDPDRPVRLGNDRFAGVIEYFSVQGALDAQDINLAPRLRFL